ncbi:TetR/AcrR family transcriptional regulator [Zhouia sp. PK063]|uniref:TetR/AcrR family transcriptional regulator n=1 Tax=Zhouia sp. PK063 TaxID=3373602 RepID=UPI0037B8663D
MNKAERTKQFIIEKTAPIFNKKGYVGTSMVDLTNATGLTKGAIYGNFADKEEVAAAAFEYNAKKIIVALNKEVDQYKHAKDKLIAYINVYKSLTNEMCERGGCPFMNMAVDTDDTQALLFAKVFAKFKNWRQRIKDILVIGKENNEINQNINEDEFADYFIALVEGSILLSKTLNDNAIMNSNLNILKQKIIEISI